jgi:post-segregation antitoxin (ccd killing protein)
MTGKTIDEKGRIPTSIKINQELWKEAKIEAINRNMDLSELVETAVKREIKSTLDLARYSLKNKRKEDD